MVNLIESLTVIEDSFYVSAIRPINQCFCYCGEIWREYDGSKILLLSLEAELHQKISMIQVGIVA